VKGALLILAPYLDRSGAMSVCSPLFRDAAFIMMAWGVIQTSATFVTVIATCK
jgi:hypothetical protein